MSNPFTPAQLRSLRRRTLRDIVCENTGLPRLRRNLFLMGDGEEEEEEEIDCADTNSLNFRLFV